MQRRLAGRGNLEAARRLVVGGRAGFFFHFVEHRVFLEFFDVVGNVSFFLVDFLFLDRPGGTVIRNGRRRWLRNRGGSGKGFLFRRIGRDFFDDLVVLNHGLAGEGRREVHAVLQGVFALPFLVGGFFLRFNVAVLLVQRLGEPGRKERLIVGEVVHDGRGNFGNGSFVGCPRSDWLAGPTAVFRNRLTG